MSGFYTKLPFHYVYTLYIFLPRTYGRPRNKGRKLLCSEYQLQYYS